MCIPGLGPDKDKPTIEQQILGTDIRIPRPDEAMLRDRPIERRGRSALRIPKDRPGDFIKSPGIQIPTS
jgi:hypothetical protein